jgi:hypothetical protein
MGGHTVNGVQQLAPSDEPFVVGRTAVSTGTQSFARKSSSRHAASPRLMTPTS